ncbi:MAG: pantetheine-phosphate adenylyltransferase [Deltaproteobacteria bacterium RIFCSPLOWO2_02_FULL_55_12]|nr:MAG: pantetheine-phosphate adenylyltransferase [Deltaproteobacteria bacterium RIFCSPLOWO2_02_FULL_55_12]
MPKHIGVYPGTFDPITRGHLDVIERGIKLFDVLIVAVAESLSKAPFFDVEERLEMIRDEVRKYKKVKVESFDCLLMDYMKKKKANIVLRGLRVVSDFEFEFQMALINRKLDPTVETVFMMTSDNYAPVSSRFIKEIARYGGDVAAFVTPGGSRKLRKKFKEKDLDAAT